MFSSVVFHDHARARGLNPILGCEVYVAPGDRRTKSGVPGETQNHLVLLAETNEGYHNLIKLVSSGYIDGFYYKPRIDKELLAQHSKGLIGLSSCLKGEVAEGLSHHQDEEGDRSGRGVPRHLRSEQLLPRDAVARHRGPADGEQRPAGDRARPEPAARLHERRPLPARHRRPRPRRAAVHRHRQGVQRSEAAALRREAVLPEDRRTDDGDLQRLPGRRCEHDAHRRALQRPARKRRELPARLRRTDRLHGRQLLRSRRARRLQGAPAAPAAVDGAGAAAPHDRRVRTPSAPTSSR